MVWSRSESWYGRDVIIADLDDDGSYEVVSGGGTPAIYDRDGGQRRTGGTEGGNLSASDVNGDGRTEVMISSPFGGEFYVLRGSTGEWLWTRTRDGARAVGDVDGDAPATVLFGQPLGWTEVQGRGKIMEKLIGRVSHYFNRIGVAVLELSGGLMVGDVVHIQGHTTDFEQAVESMEIQHQQVQSVGPGAEVALHVIERVRKGDAVYKVFKEG